MAFAYKPSHSKTYRIGWYDKKTGKTKTISAGTTDKRIAKSKARDVNARKRLNLIETTNDPAINITLEDALKLYLNQEQRAAKTITAYKTAVNIFIDVAGNRNVIDYSKTHYLRFIQKLRNNNYAVNSIANYTRHLHAIFKWLVEADYLEKNIIKRTKAYKKDVEPIPPDDLKTILNHLLKKEMIKQHNLVKIMFLCAFRIGEAIKCLGEDFRLKEGTIFIRNTKGKRKEFIPMLDDIRAFILEAKLAKEGRLFDYTCPDSARTFWNTAMKELNFKYTFHQLRKSRGTQLANGKAAPLFVHQFMRHKDFNTTLEYYIKINMDLATKDLNTAMHNLDYLK